MLLSTIERKCLIRCGLSPQPCRAAPHSIQGPPLSVAEKEALITFGKLGPPGAFIPGETSPLTENLEAPMKRYLLLAVAMVAMILATGCGGTGNLNAGPTNATINTTDGLNDQIVKFE